MDLEGFYRFLDTPAARIVLLLAGAGILCVLGGFTVVKIREMFRERGPSASDMISNFRDLHLRGELSDEEYRNIKAKLGKQLREQVGKSRPQAPAELEVEFEDAGDDA